MQVSIQAINYRDIYRDDYIGNYIVNYIGDIRVFI